MSSSQSVDLGVLNFVLANWDQDVSDETTINNNLKMNGSLALNDVNTLSNNSQFKISQLGLDIDGENANDQSGFSVSTNEDGTIVAIGEPFFDNRGRTRIFRFNGTIWQSLGNNIVGEVGDLSGSSVSLSADGNRVAIGAPGRDSEQETLDGVSLPVISQGTTRIFEYNETNNEWDQLGDDIDGEDSNIINGAEFTGGKSGKSVSLNADGNRVAIGAPIQSTGRGSTRIFEYDGLNNRWIQMGGNIIYANNFENSGKSVSLSADGTIVAIGADGSSNNGRTSIFQYDNENNIWTQLGDDIDGNESDNSGSSVSLNANGNRVAIGAPGHNTSQGTTRIFEYNEANNQWNQLGTNEDGSPQDLDGINTNELSGNSVSLSADGNRIAIGSPFALNILDKKGIMRVYEFNGIRWNQIDVDINGELNADRNGTSVSLSGDGNKVVVGAPGHDSNKGTARVYEIRRTLDIKSDGGITFNTGSETDNSLTERMHITTDGFINMSSNVGIGGATAPAIPLAIGDDDTGIDHPEDNTLTLKTGGFERMRITDEGEVKIQSETPYLTLKNTTEENTDGGAESKLIFQDHSDTTLAQIEASHEGTEDDTKGQLVLSTNDGTNLTERMRVTAGGNIGIAGATAPALSLAIGDNDTGIDHPADDTLTLRTGGFERMRIAANGFVGISQQNITNPSNFLHIKGDPSTAVNANNYASENGFGQIHIETVSNFVNAGNQGTSKLKIGIQQTEDNNAPTSYLQCINDNTIAGKLLLNPAGGNVCTGAGNVGIGTTNPDGGKLHIMGNIYLVHGLVTNSFFAARTEAGNGKPEGEGRFILRWKDRVDTNKTENVEIVMNNNGVETACGFFQGSGNPNNAINFTGQHRCILNKNIDETSYGLIVSSNGKYVNTNNTLLSSINESLPLCSLTNMDNDKKVFGVISEKEDSNDLREFGSGFVSQFKKANKNEQRVFINSLGEGAVWVCDKNGILENGDYISSSSVTGYGMKQTVNGGLLCNFTVGKITCDCNFSLTKVVKQKLKTNVVIDTDGKEQTEIDYDVDGNVQYEDDLDSEGNQQMVYPLETRFLQADGTQLADEAEYNTRKAEGEDVYIACFVGCTYHCG